MAGPSRPWFLGVSVSIFAACTAATIAGCIGMSSMGDMPMPGGWRMSMAWMHMPAQTWLSAGLSFLGMWLAMMAGMMLPSLLPVLWRYHRDCLRTDARHAGERTGQVAAGYFFVWAVLGASIYVSGSILAAAAMHWPTLARAVPVGRGLTLLAAGMLQFTRWKARHLDGCRRIPGCCTDAGTAWRRGIRHGIHCCHCCAGLTAILLVAGVMDLFAMALVTAAITAERLAPAGRRVAWVTGVMATAAGVLLLASAAGWTDSGSMAG